MRLFHRASQGREPCRRPVLQRHAGLGPSGVGRRLLRLADGERERDGHDQQPLEAPDRAEPALGRPSRRHDLAARRDLHRRPLHQLSDGDVRRSDHRPPVPGRARHDRRQLCGQHGHADDHGLLHLVLGLRDLQLRSHPLHRRRQQPPAPRRGSPALRRLHADDQHDRPRHVPGRADGRGRHRRPDLRKPLLLQRLRFARTAATATASTPRTSARRPSPSTTTSSSSSSAGASTPTARAGTSTTSTSRATSPSTTAASPAAGTPTSSSEALRIRPRTPNSFPTTPTTPARGTTTTSAIAPAARVRA